MFPYKKDGKKMQVVKILIIFIVFFALSISCPVIVNAVGSITVYYTYDDEGRLVKESYSTGLEKSYAYDVNGNRLSLQVVDPNSDDEGDDGGGSAKSAGGGGSGCFIRIISSPDCLN